MGVSEGKLHYVEVSTEKEPFMISSFSLGNLRVGQKLNYSCPTNVNRLKRTCRGFCISPRLPAQCLLAETNNLAIFPGHYVELVDILL
jgi:hypothetical protein